MRLNENKSGFTLVELVLVIVIIGILAAVAVRSGSQLFETARTEQTKQELEDLAFAIAGNPNLHNNGIRSDFGYVGDVGAVPPNLDALVSNPGGYATWNGPYISNRFLQVADDYKKDAWGNNYLYTPGTTIASPVGIVRRVVDSNGDLVGNQVSGIVLDFDGTPPGEDRDSITVFIAYPDGAGGRRTQTSSVDAGGYFAFDSIPIGNHAVGIVKLPEADTMMRFISVNPGASVYQQYRLTDNIWYGGSIIPALVGHYPLDEGAGQTTFDASGQAVDLKLQYDVAGAGWSAGKIGGAFDFDGTDDYFDMATSATELQITGDYSASVWIFADSDQTGRATIFSKCASSGSDHHWTLQWDNLSGTAKRLTLSHPGGDNWRSAYTLAEARGAWHHIAVTYRAAPARVQLYVDGVFHSESSSLTTLPVSGPGRFRIGADGSGNVWRGLIDDVRIYRRVLTPSDIQTLYDMGAAL